MKLLLDYGPLAAFGLAYWWGDIYLATEVFIGASIIAVLVGWLMNRRINKVHLVTAIAAAVLGSLTLAFHDPAFIKFKPTLIYALFAIALLGSQALGGTVLLARIPQTVFAPPDWLWRRINLAWGLFFIALAVLNLYVAHEYDEATWVKFKLFGFTALSFVFMLAHLPFIAPYLQTDEASAPDKPSPP